MKNSRAPVFAKHHSEFIVGIIDIVRSTELTSSLSLDQVDDFYMIFLNGIFQTLRSHGAYIIKNTGDGALFYFPHHEISEHTVQKVLTCGKILLIERDTINKELRAKHLPAVDYRISMSYGPVSVMLNHDGHIVDLFGATVNTCAKINSMAIPNSFVVGEALAKLSVSPGVTLHQIGIYTVNPSFSFPVFQVDS